MAVNSLGGDMPEDRMNRIRDAWCERYGKTWEDWLYFQANTKPRDTTAPVEEESFQYPLCPTYEEMGLRHKKKADLFRAMAEKDGVGPVMAAKYRDEAESYYRIAERMFYLSDQTSNRPRVRKEPQAIDTTEEETAA